MTITLNCTVRSICIFRLARTWPAAHEVDARFRLGGKTLDQAVRHIVREAMARESAGAGVIAIGVRGEPILAHNTLGMIRGFVAANGNLHVVIHSIVI